MPGALFILRWQDAEDAVLRLDESGLQAKYVYKYRDWRTTHEHVKQMLNLDVV